MKITSIELHPTNSSFVAVLSFRDPSRQNPYNVKSIVGLDADEIVARFYRGSGSSSTKFYNLLLQKRDIVLRIELNPDYSEEQSPSSLRDSLYKMISSARTGLIELQFKNSATVVAVISGFVSKFEADLFTKTPEVQITLDCGETMLRAPELVEFDVEEIDPEEINFEDPLSTAPHGFKFDIEFLADAAFFSMADPNDSSWLFEVIPVGGFLDNDILHFSSEVNNKSLLLTRGLTEIHLADVITANSVWPILFPGDNFFELNDIEERNWLSVVHYPTYWGV